MNHLPKIILKRVRGNLGSVAYEFTRVELTSFQKPPVWVPAINAYRCRHEFVICVDLAGVDRAEIDLEVEPRRIWIRGQRELHEPEAADGPPLHMLAMEISQGEFARELVLPAEVETNHVRAEQRNGLLWISLPLRSADG